MALIRTFSLAALALTLAACGHTMEQRAASGALGGAVIAGPVGAIAGAATGAAIDQSKKAEAETTASPQQ